MLFPTVDFAVFFVIVFTGSWLLRPYAKPWRWFILLASCIFYLDPFNTQKAFVVPSALGLLVAMGVLGWLLTGVIAPDEGDSGNFHGAWWKAAGPVALLVAFYSFGNIWLFQNAPGKNQQSWVWLFLLLGIAFLNQAWAKAAYATMGPGRSRTDASKWFVRLAVVNNLAVLGIFKYYDWFRSSFPLAGFLPEWFVGYGLPIAISFFTFQAISYVIDVGRGEIRPVKLLDFCVYLTFFAHLVAGPIVRVGEFVPQLSQRADPRFVQSGEAFMLIFRGMFKKVVISSWLAANLVDPVFGVSGGHVPGEFSKLIVLFAILGYAIQIYADFSGYTDIAIGVALLLGIRFPQNFDAPYRSLSIQEFWRRWHMTLSRWLRDYLYIPLGGNRRGIERTYVNLFLTMFLGGLWHGANITFLIWGSIHGAALGAERAIKAKWARRAAALGVPAPIRSVLQWALTFTIVCVAWVFFRATSFGDAWNVLGQLLTSSEPTPTDEKTVRMLQLGAVIIAGSIASQFVPQRVPERISVVFTRLAPALQIAALFAGLLLVDALGPEGIAPFIYFQF